MFETSEVLVPLYPPGRLVLLDRFEAAADGTVAKTGGSARARALETGPCDYDRILLSFTLMGYHLPIRYITLLLAVLEVSLVQSPGEASADADGAGDAETVAIQRLRRRIQQCAL